MLTPPHFFYKKVIWFSQELEQALEKLICMILKMENLFLLVF